MSVFDPAVRSHDGQPQPTSVFEAFGWFFPFLLLFQILAVIVFVGLESSILLYKAAVPTSSMFWIAGIWLLLSFNAACQPEKYDPPKSSRAISPVFRTAFLKLSGKNIYFAQENSLKTIFLLLVTHTLYQQQLDVDALTF